MDTQTVSPDDMVDILRADPDEWAALDTETTGLTMIRDGRHYGIGFSVAMPHEGVLCATYAGVQHPAGGNVSGALYEALSEALEGLNRIYWQNYKYDRFAFLTMGVTTDPEYFIDGAVAAHLLDENNPRQKTLAALYDRWVGDGNGKITDDPFVEKEKKSGNQHITPAQMFEYGAQDAVATWKLDDVLRHRLIEEEMMPHWQHKADMLRWLWEMERRGVKIDRPVAREAAQTARERMAELTEAVGINLGSPKQLQGLLLGELEMPVVKRTPKGAPSMDKEAMEEYDILLERADSPVAKQIKEYRGWQKATTASYEPYLLLADPSNDRIHPNYRLDVARTGRFSCTDPNLQQVPKEGDKPWKSKTKGCFIPEPGYVLVNADYSQLELRLGTLYAQEEHLVEVFMDPERDVFNEMSERLGMTRQDTKTLTYSMQYGAGVNRIMHAFGVDERTAKELIQNYFDTYPNFRALNRQVADVCKKQGYVQTWSGRRRRLVPYYMKDENGKSKRIDPSYKAMNAMIQGGAADIVERVMLRAKDLLDDERDCRMLLQVHDALVWEVREELVEDAILDIKEVMEDVVAATGEKDFAGMYFAVDAHPDYGSKGWTWN